MLEKQSSLYAVKTQKMTV